MPLFGWRKRYTKQFPAMRSAVTIGNRSVGMLSLSGNTSAGSAGERPDARRVLGNVLVGAVGAAPGRSGRDVVEAKPVRRVFERLELVGMPVAHDRQMALGRPQVLPHGEHLDAGVAQVLEGGDHLCVRL